MITRPDPQTVPPFYKNYVELVKEMDLLDALRDSSKFLQDVLSGVPEQKGDYRYDTGKWTIKELLNHMMDAERIFAYRALRFSRNDQTPLPAFEENDYAPRANAHSRTMKQLGFEMQRLRATTIDLYSSFSEDMLMLEGTASNKRISVLNLGYIIAGHEMHHTKILQERYLKK
jgi:uncharacterized damage-inducible protein DinB